jgi:hypothetical protein
MVKVTLSIDEQVWRDFHAECIRRGLKGGKEVERLMQEQLAQWAAQRSAKDGDK